MTSPAPSRLHQRISFRLATILDNAVPEGLEIQEAINVRLVSGRIVIPDVVVHDQVGTDGTFVSAADVLLVVEIVSPSTEQFDRLLKPGLAAEAGIPYFVHVEPDGPTVIVYELDDGSYRQVTTATGEKRLTVSMPFPVDFQPAELLASRRA